MADNVNRNPTPEEQARYIQEGGTRCIFDNCLSHNLDCDNINSGEGNPSQAVTCTACGGSWTDCYSLTEVEHV